MVSRMPSVFGLSILFALLLAAFLPLRLDAKTIVYDLTAVSVRIVYGTPTIFRFQKAVQTITGAGRLEVGPTNKGDYTSLSIKPRFTNGSHDVTFFLIDKTVVSVKISVSPKDPGAEAFYDFKPRGSEEAESKQGAVSLSEVELLKVMVKDVGVAGYKVINMSQTRPSTVDSGKFQDCCRVDQLAS